MGDEEWLLSVEDVSQDKWVGLVGAARLSPERTEKVGTAARPGCGDAVGRAAPGLLLVRPENTPHRRSTAALAIPLGPPVPRFFSGDPHATAPPMPRHRRRPRPHPEP